MSRRRTRPTASQTPIVRDGFGRIRCRWCGQVASKKLKTFCSKECVHNWRLRSDSGYLRKVVFARDKGVCYNCGMDTEKLRKSLVFLTPEVRNQKLLASGFHPKRSLWEAHHAHPIADGCVDPGDINLIVTACYVCHQKITNSWRDGRSV